EGPPGIEPHRMATTSVAPRSARRPLTRRASAFLFRHRGAQLTFTLGPTLTWMVVIYLFSLVVLLLSSFWTLNPYTSQIEHTWSFQNYQTILHGSVYWRVTFRTVVLAAAVTVTDVLLAFPLAYYAARMASPRIRNALLFAVVMPLWANYLVKVFAWKTMLGGDGPVDAFFGIFGFHPELSSSIISLWIVLSYIWLPYVILPILAAFERVPDTYLEASGDLGARSGRTFRKIVFPLVLPGVVAATIFSFSLTLGDYLAAPLVSKTLVLGNMIDQLAGGTANNKPLAAAISMIPLAIMGIYLLIARAMHAFEAL
ncbi:MAG TPA: ABC transporter permease, partial [Actinomycetota bacterium]|nr:ABC transporter permease [Actinomycetota bacterium]